MTDRLQTGVEGEHRREQLAMARRLQLAERRQRDKREERQDSEQAVFDMAVAAAQLIELELRQNLELYHTATVIALEENARLLEEQRVRLDAMRDRAHVLPDGRRVFKSIDGERVFDEHGERVDRGEIEPDEIGDDRPHWEAYQRELEREQALRGERQDILDYQDQLDEAEDKLDQGGLSDDELKALEEELELSMPPSVRRQAQALEGRDMTGKEGTLRTSFNGAAPAPLRPDLPTQVHAPTFE